MSGYVDLHVHYVPNVDDGVRSTEDGIALCRGLGALGYDTLVATPHIRTAMWENQASSLRQAHATFVGATRAHDGIPHLDLGAEHFFDDVFMSLVARGEALPYPGNRAILVEFPSESMLRRFETPLFTLHRTGMRAVLAHPERYSSLFRATDAIDRLLDMGMLCQLDLMSLVGKYGSEPQRAAERMLEEGVYEIACTDAHKPSDVLDVGRALDRLRKRVGDEEATDMLRDAPRRILEGKID